MALGACGLVGVFVAAVALPGFRRLQRKRETIRATQVNVGAELSTVSNLAQVYADVTRLSQEVRDFSTAIPSDHEFAESYRALSRMLEDSGLSRKSIEPGRCGPLPPKLLAGGPKLLGDVMVQPVTICATGKLEGFVKFVGELEQWKRLNTVDRMRLSIDRGRGGQLSGEFTIMTYYLPRHDDRRMASADDGRVQQEP
jgi:Tfp pilus assembly protein PilO